MKKRKRVATDGLGGPDGREKRWKFGDAVQKGKKREEEDDTGSVINWLPPGICDCSRTNSCLSLSLSLSLSVHHVCICVSLDFMSDLCRLSSCFFLTSLPARFSLLLLPLLCIIGASVPTNLQPVSPISLPLQSSTRSQSRISL